MEVFQTKYKMEPDLTEVLGHYNSGAQQFGIQPNCPLPNRTTSRQQDSILLQRRYTCFKDTTNEIVIYRSLIK